MKDSLPFLSQTLQGKGLLDAGQEVYGMWRLWFWVLPVALQGPGSLSVKEPVSSLPQIYGDASAKLSHMVFPTRWEPVLRLQRSREKGREIMLKSAK